MTGKGIIGDMFSQNIVGAALTAITANQVVTKKSGYNTTSTPVKAAPGLVNAMIKIFMCDNIGIGKTKSGCIFIEVSGSVAQRRKAILYDPGNQTLKGCQFNPKEKELRTPITDQGNRTPIYLAIPHLVNQRLTDMYSELALAWDEVIKDISVSYPHKLNMTDGASTILDSAYFGADDYPIELADVSFLDVVPEKVYDITPDLLAGKSGEFQLTKKAVKPTHIDTYGADDSEPYEKQMRDMRQQYFPLVKEYYDAMSDEDKALVPDEDRLGIYIPTRLFKNTVEIIADGIKNGDLDSQNVLLKGPPGVGKSVMALAIAYVFSMPYRFTQSYKTADASEYIGTTVADNGVLKTNIHTQFAETVMRGGVHADDDNNYSAEGENTVKNSVLIAPYTIKLADGSMVKRHPFSVFMMSANPDMKGARPINEAYKDRFCVIVDLKKLSEKELIRMVMERSRYGDTDTVSRMVQAWMKINADISQTGESADMLSPRNLVNWAKQTRILGDPLEACEYNLLASLCASEEYKMNVFSNIIRPLFKRRDN